MKVRATRCYPTVAVGLLAIIFHLSSSCAYGFPREAFCLGLFSLLGPQEQQAAESEGAKEPGQKISLSGVFAADFRGLKSGPASGSASSVSSDIYIRAVDLAFESSFAEWLEAIAVLNSEFIGDYLNPEEEKISLDEVHVDILIPQTPFYIIIGKRTQPFGLFENYLMTDPLTQDAYETSKVGFTAGFKGPQDAQMGFTLYKGEEQMDHLFGSGLFDNAAIQRQPAMIPKKVDSFIISASISPIKDCLTLFGAYLSEPGWDTKNTTLNLSFSFSVPPSNNLI